MNMYYPFQPTEHILMSLHSNMDHEVSAISQRIDTMCRYIGVISFMLMSCLMLCWLHACHLSHPFRGLGKLGDSPENLDPYQNP